MARKRLLLMMILLPLVALLWLVGWSLYRTGRNRKSVAPVQKVEDQTLIAIIDKEEAAISVRSD
ncbi:MAG: hypothetical protein NWE81_02245 [Candidatus Bathyarchaeota archaeon]|nr:hypothetical protein [Candidatus Bathyarchaeota archaeon]